MVDKKTIIFGALFFVILLTSGIVYVTLGEEVKIRIDDDKTTLYVFEDSRWVVGGREYNRLFDGSSRMNRRSPSIIVESNFDNISNTATITRTTPYIRGPIVIDTYVFDGLATEKELVPISHKVEVINGSGYYYRYYVDDLTGTGDKRKLTGETSLSFGRNVNVELHPDYRWAWIGWPYGSDSLAAQYSLNSNYEVFNVRLFDPDVQGTNPDAHLWFQFDENYNDSKGVGQGWTFDSGSGVFNTTQVAYGNASIHVPNNFQMLLGNFATIPKTNSYSISIWNFEDENNSKDVSYIVDAMAGTAERLFIYQSGYDIVYKGTFDDGGAQQYSVTCSGCGGRDVGRNTMYSIIWDNTSKLLMAFVNDTNIGNVSTGVASTFLDDITSLRLGRSGSANNAGNRDNLVSYWGVMTQTEVSNLYNYGSMDGPPTNISLYLEGNQSSLIVELGSIINVSATHSESGETVCIDVISHPEYQEINHSCGVNSTSFNLNITYFRETQFNDSNTTKNFTYSGAENHTWYVSAHQYDVVENFTINLTGYESGGTFPAGVKVYINNTLSTAVGLLVNTSTTILTSFSDSTTTKNVTFTEPSTSILGYLKLPKEATISGAFMNFTGLTEVAYIGFQETPDSHFVNSTGAGPWFTVGSQYIYLNYTKPVDSVTAKHISIRGSSGSSIGVNYSNIINNDHSCWVADVSTLIIRMGSWIRPDQYSSSFTNSSTECYTNSSWTMLDFEEDSSHSMSGSDCSNNIVNYPFRSFDGDKSSYAGWESITFRWCNITEDFVGISRLYDEAVYWGYDNYTIDPWMEVGEIDGVYEWNYSGTFDVSNNNSNNFSSAITSYLSTCTADDNGFCLVPIYVHTDNVGKINGDGINVTYVYDVNPVQLSVNVAQTFINSSLNNVNIPIVIESSGSGIIKVDDVKYDYLGRSQTYELKAHNTTYGINDSYNVTLFYSGWDYSFPTNIAGIDFLPARPTDDNVSPFGQTPTIPILNVSWENVDANASLFIKLSTNDSCINMSAAINNNSENKQLITNVSWLEITSNEEVNATTGIWLWADYECSYSTWNLWNPTFYFRTCVKDYDVCDEDVG